MHTEEVSPPKSFYEKQYVCLYSFVHMQLNLQNQPEPCPVLSAIVVNAGKRVAQQGYKVLGSEILQADTYRSYKASVVLS